MNSAACEHFARLMLIEEYQEGKRVEAEEAQKPSLDTAKEAF